MADMKPGRNDPCPCGSGKKYKKCCQENSEFTPTAPKNPGKGMVPTAAECNQLVAMFNGGHFDEVETWSRLLLDRYPDSGFAWKALGAALQIQNKDSLFALQKATEFLPKDAEAHYNLGNTLKEMGRLNEAEASYLRALKIKPDFAMAHNNLGLTLHEMRQLGKAEASYQRALRMNPNFAEAHYNLGFTLQELGRLKEAQGSYRRALEVKPDYADAHRKLGITLYMMGQLDEAEAGFRRALQIKPDYAEVYSNLGVVLHKLGRLDEAEASFRQALQIKPDYAEAYYNLGNILNDVRRLNEAEVSYRRALEIRPDYVEVYNNLGYVLRELGKLDEALACYQQQLKLTPGNDMAQHHIASLTGSNTERAPIQYVENIFDLYADKFDLHLQQFLMYDAPEKLVALVKQHLVTPVEKWNVLDLGCGTGLVGAAIAPLTRQLVGVDLSSRMVEKARARNLYQRLERSDLLTMMRAEKTSSYDVIIAADVFIYLGKLDEIISEIKRLLCPGGVFAFSIEAHEVLSNEEPSQGALREYQLENTGRYSHSPGYITRLASDNGFVVQEMGPTQLRMERDKKIDGYLVLWKSCAAQI